MIQFEGRANTPPLWRVQAGVRNRAALTAMRAHPNRKKDAARMQRTRDTIDKWAAGHESNPYYRAAMAMRAASNPAEVVTFFQCELMADLESKSRAELLDRWQELVVEEHQAEGEQNRYAYSADAERAEAAYLVHARYCTELAVIRRILAEQHGVNDPDAECKKERER